MSIDMLSIHEEVLSTMEGQSGSWEHTFLQNDVAVQCPFSADREWNDNDDVDGRGAHPVATTANACLALS